MINKITYIKEPKNIPKEDLSILENTANSSINRMKEIVNTALFTHKCYENLKDSVGNKLSFKHKRDVNNWISSFKPTHFLTVQLPENKKTALFERSKEHLRKIMAAFEYRLIGRHWNKKHLFFIAFAELGKSDRWHYHVLFNHGKYTKQQLEIAMLRTMSALHMPLYCLKLDLISKYPNKVTSYCTKELRIKDYGTFDSSRIIPSTDLFGFTENALPKAQ
ncbi:MAG: hypothetical protein IKL33_01935 [Alphaproteobacteria bacterium]|nr:hypothetical protein [Alphaproteobacteria bacterium]